MSSTVAITLTVNGAEHVLSVPARTSLADILRGTLGLTGTHVGCEQGVCGACTVVFNGQAVRSCLVLGPQADAGTVQTVEGLAAADGSLHPLQESFRSCHGLQCGFRTPGILMTLLAEANAGTGVDDVISESLPGHLCRCTGYVNIRRAIRDAWPAVHPEGGDADA